MAVAIAHGALAFALLVATQSVLGRFGADTVILLALSGVLLGWIAVGLAQLLRRGARVPTGVLVSAASALLLWLLLATRLSPAHAVSSDSAWHVATIGLGCLALAWASPGEQSWRGVLAAGVAYALLAAAAGAYQFAVEGAAPRGFQLNANSHAAVLTLPLFGVLGVLLARTGGTRAGTAVQWSAALLLAASVGLSGSRGAFLATLLGMAVLAGAAWYARRGKRGAAVLGAAAVALVLGGQAVALMPKAAPAAPPFASVAAPRPQTLYQRLSRLPDYEATGRHRVVIWKATIDMWRDAPWYGAGPGVYWLLYPRYRDPSDTSAGFHAHNDYLELAVELGWPGLGLLLLVAVGSVAAGWRLLRRERTGSGASLGAAGVAAGVIATFAHSAVDFNLHILSVTLLLGFWVGRLAALECAGRTGAATTPAWLGAALGRAVAGAALAAIGSLAAFHLIPEARIAAGYERAIFALGGSREREAMVQLEQLARSDSRRELVYLALGQFYLELLRASPTMPQSQRRSVFERGIAHLAAAEQFNPLRSDTAYLAGVFRSEHPELAGPRWFESARSYFQAALERDPRNLEARNALVQMLLEAGRTDEARATAEAGLREAQPSSDALLVLMGLAAELRYRAGDGGGAMALARQADAVLAAHGKPRVFVDVLTEMHPDLRRAGW